MDDPNLSDAILLALRAAGWIGRLVICDAPMRPPKPKKRLGRPPRPDRPPHERSYRGRTWYPIPAGLTLPPGVAWNYQSGRTVVRVSIDRRMKHVCMLPGTQEGAERARELVALAKELRDAGYDIDTIKERARAALKGASDA